MTKTFLTISVLIFSTQVFCEYRVYQYYVRSKLQNITSVPSEIVTSTLNPISYVAYHGGNESVEVNLLRSWQCMGNTSKQPVCSISEGKELTEAPSLGAAQ
jgi:hypothetical protein